LAKKQKKVKAKPAPTKRQLSKWQRQQKINRIIAIAAAVFLVGVLGYVGVGYYDDTIKPSRETVIKVNDASFSMGYFINMLDAYTKGTQPNESHAEFVASQIEDNELMKQGANDLGIWVEKEEVDEKIKESDLPDSEVYRDMVTGGLLRQKLLDYFGSQLSDEMEQVHIQVMLVESQQVANNVTAELEAGGNFTALLEEFSYDPATGGDLGWLPADVMTPLIADIIPDVKAGEVRSIYDDVRPKSVGYWLIKVTDKNEEGDIYAHAMLLGSEEEAGEVKAELAVGGNFTQLAEEYSQDVSKVDGGDLGWLKEGDMGSEIFDRVAFTLELNEVSEPVRDERQTQGAYWIIEILDKGLHELSDEVRQGLEMQDLDDWLLGQREISTIDSYLDAGKIFWAIQQVMERR